MVFRDRTRNNALSIRRVTQRWAWWSILVVHTASIGASMQKHEV
jgi:hypothetical protein